MRFYVDRVKVKRLAEVKDESFTIIVGYDITWSDRYAVHPCKIPLYSYGKGVPSTGKIVPADKWWKPNPSKGDNTYVSYKHAQNLKVHHTISTDDEVGKPGPLVTQACTTLSCPWPKQLFLRDKIVAEVKTSATWDYAQYPFDKQMVRMKLPLLDEGSFIEYEASDALVNVTLPLQEQLTAVAESLYGPTNWLVYSSAVKLEDASTLVFELKIQRNSMATVFKVIIPMGANALLLMLSTKLKIDNRLKIISLSMVVAGAMLNPAFLGLPGNVSGVPFVQSLVIIHMMVALIMLIYTGSVVTTDLYYEKALEDTERDYDASVKGVWKKHASTYTHWAEWLQRQRFVKSGGSNVPSFGPSASDPTVSKKRAKVGEATTTSKQQQMEQVQISFPSEEDDASGNATTATLQRATVELLLSLPALFHRKDPTRPPTIWNPFQELRPGFMPRYNESLKSRGDRDRIMTKVLPALFIIFWILDIVIYFGIIDGDPQ